MSFCKEQGTQPLRIDCKRKANIDMFMWPEKKEGRSGFGLADLCRRRASVSRLISATVEGNDENISLLFLLDESCATPKEGHIFVLFSLFEALSVLGRERWRMVEGRRTKRAEALRKTLRGSFESNCRKWFVFRHLIA